LIQNVVLPVMTASPGADRLATSESPLLHRTIEWEARGARSLAADKRGIVAKPKGIAVVLLSRLARSRSRQIAKSALDGQWGPKLTLSLGLDARCRLS
jgi:hypothetical protein